MIKLVSASVAATVCLGLTYSGARATVSAPPSAPAGTDVRQPEWAPNGRDLAVTLASRTPGTLRLAVLHLSGGSPQLENLTSGNPRTFDASWSPDGKSIAYGRANPATKADLYVMDIRGRHQRLLGKAVREPAWSPSGAQIVGWVETNRAPQRLVIIGSRTGARKVIKLGRKYYFRLPFWSRDGKRIGFLADGGSGPAYVIPKTGGKPRVLERKALPGASWSHDWKNVAFTERKGELFVADHPYRKARRLTRPGSGQIDTQPAWSSDDKWIAFVRSKTDGSHSSLFIVRSNGSGLRQVLRAGA